MKTTVKEKVLNNNAMVAFISEYTHSSHTIH